MFRTKQTYEAFRTGLTFAEVRAMMWSPDPDPRTWRHKGVSVWWDSPDGRVKAPALRACPEHTTAPVGGATPIDNAAAQLDRILHAVADVRDLLWPADEPDRSWSPDTIAEIADRLAFLHPDKGGR